MLTIATDASGLPQPGKGKSWVAWACVASDQRTLHGRIRQSTNSTLGELVAITQAATLIDTQGRILSDSSGMVAWIKGMRSRPDPAAPVPHRYRWIPDDIKEQVAALVLSRPAVLVQWRRRNSTPLMRRAHQHAEDARTWRIAARRHREEARC